jgi:methyl-accepting chemotaxis protein
MDVIRRTAKGGAAGDGARLGESALEDAALFRVHEQAARSVAESAARAERLAAVVTQQRGLVEAAAERSNLISARAEGLGPSAARVTEAFERLGVVALNAGLEGARTAEPQARALLLVSEEIRANVRRGADAAEQLARAVEDIAAESAEVRRQLERSRGPVTEIAQEAGQVSAAAQQASKSLDDLGALLRKATGIDPEMARAVALATEHARGLMTALSTLSTAREVTPLLGALSPVMGPLSRLIAEIDGGPAGGDREEDEGGS